MKKLLTLAEFKNELSRKIQENSKQEEGNDPEGKQDEVIDELDFSGQRIQDNSFNDFFRNVSNIKIKVKHLNFSNNQLSNISSVFKILKYLDLTCLKKINLSRNPHLSLPKGDMISVWNLYKDSITGGLRELDLSHTLITADQANTFIDKALQCMAKMLEDRQESFLINFTGNPTTDNQFIGNEDYRIMQGERNFTLLVILPNGGIMKYRSSPEKLEQLYDTINFPTIANHSINYSIQVNDQKSDEESTSLLNSNRFLGSQSKALWRFLWREQWLKFFAEKIVLNFHPSYRTYPRHLWLSHTLPIVDDVAHSALQKIHGFFRGLNNFADPLWTFAVLALGLQDAIQFKMNSSQRYGAKTVDLLTGFYRRRWGLLGGYYDGFPNQPAFWIMPGAMLATPLLMAGIEMVLLQRVVNNPSAMLQTLAKSLLGHPVSTITAAMPWSHYRRTLNAAAILIAWEKNPTFLLEDILDTIAVIAEFGSLLLAIPAMATLTQIANSPLSDEYMHDENVDRIPLSRLALQRLNGIADRSLGLRSEVARYQRWTLGQPTHALRHMLYGLSVWLRTSILAYTTYRYFQILEQRTQQGYDFFTQQEACNRTWNYSPITGEYDCTICGNYSFVPAQLANNPQGCLDSLLANGPSLNLSTTVNTLRYLRHFSGYRHADLSNWNLANMAGEELQSLLSNVTALSSTWEIFNISSRQMSALWSSNNTVALLGQELNHVTINSVDIHQQNFNPEQWQTFLTHWVPQGLRELYAGQIPFGNNGTFALADWISNRNVTLNTLSLPGNGYANAGLQTLLPSLLANQTHFLDISNNQFNGDILRPLGQWLINSRLQTLILDNNDLSNGDYRNFGQALSVTYTLSHLQMNGINLNDFNLALLANNQSLPVTVFSAANNQITVDGIQAFAQTASNATHVNWAFNRIDGSQLPVFQTLLRQVQWRSMDLSGNEDITASQLAAFWPSLLNTTVRHIRTADLRFSDEAFYPLHALLSNGTLVLEGIDLSGNSLSNDFAGELLNIACQRNVSLINFSNNELTAIFGAINQWPLQNFYCQRIILNNNRLEENNTILFVKHFPNMSLLEAVDISNNPKIGDKVIQTLAENAVTPVDNPDDLQTQPMSYDATRALNQSQALIHARIIRIENSNVTKAGAVPLCNILPHLPNTQVKVSSADVTVNELQNCQTSSATRLRPWLSRAAFWRTQSNPDSFTSIYERNDQPAKISFSQFSALNNNREINNNTLSASFILSALPGMQVIFLLLAVYWLARKFMAATSSFWQRSTEESYKPNEKNSSSANDDNYLGLTARKNSLN